MTDKSSDKAVASRNLKDRLYHPAVVWLLRLAVGAVFILSGFVKAVDPWGSIIKIGEYLAVWGVHVPSRLVVVGAFALAGFEFLWGVMLLCGIYRKVSVWILGLMMGVMLPLTFYIAVANPVSDCGCFGDFLILSNTATFAKNILISLALLYLIIYNNRTPGVLADSSQWLAGGLTTIFILGVELFGYNVQPLIDFRRFSPGTELLSVGNEADAEDVVYGFVYEKDGITREFDEDQLPDSTWQFVERKLVSGSEKTTDGFAVIEDGEDIAPDIIAESGEQFIVTIPDARQVDLSGSYLLNDLNDYIKQRGGSMIALVGSGDEDIDWWKDVSMADYPIYRAESKLLKEFARGTVALVYLREGKVVWKRTLTSLSYTLATDTPKENVVDEMNPNCQKVLEISLGIYISALVLLIILDRSGKLVVFAIRRNKLKTRNK